MVRGCLIEVGAMDFKEVAQKRRDMDRAIFSAVDAFQKETGCKVSDVGVLNAGNPLGKFQLLEIVSTVELPR